MITLDYKNKESLAGGIAHCWHSWNSQRVPVMDLWAEIDSYLQATDTSSLEGGEHFDHKTHIPILGELHEDLIAIVYSTLFPHEDWLGWKGFEINAITKQIRNTMLSYIKQVHALNGFSKEMRQLVDDLIRYGNCFNMVHYIDKSVKDGDVFSSNYSGPANRRISPFDIVFNPTASSFVDTPKIIRSLVSLGEFHDLYKTADTETELSEEDYTAILEKRNGSTLDYSEQFKENQYIPSGFGSIQEYYNSGSVEILWFYGDIFDDTTSELHRNRCIAIVDRLYVFMDKEELNPKIFKGSWSPRPDNLWSQGPLDKVVGINYMINHRENGKNDAIDKFIYPDRAYVGDVEEIYDEVTGHTKYILPEGGSVQDIRPDSTVLTFDNQIMMHRDLARQSARLPQQLMGFKVAGEQTATEYQGLIDGAFRGFINKTTQFEEDVLEPSVAAELQVALDNFTSVIKILEEDEQGVLLTQKVTEDDLKSNGKLIPMGSKRFSRQLQQLQGLNQLANTNLGTIIGEHLDTFQLAKVVEELYGFDKFNFIKKFRAIDEQVEREKKSMLAEQEIVGEASQPTLLEEEMAQMEDPFGGMSEEPI